MEPISRRRALQLGALGAAGVVVGGWGLTRQFTDLGGVRTTGGGGALGSPAELRSTGGTLRVELDAAPFTGDVAGRRVSMLGYADGVPGPTLRLRPGDRLQVQLRNNLDEATNLHVHGLHVSPEGNADNPFLTINPGETFDYDYQLPTDHPAGTFWCHPHLDGSVADQLFAGLYGAIVVEEDNPVPVARERVLVISGVLRRPGNRPPPLPHGPDDGPRGRPAAGQRPGHTGARGPPGRAGTLARRQRLHVPLPAARRRRLQLLEMVER